MTNKKLILVFAVLYSVNGYSGVHKCTDEKGHVQYSNTTCATKEDRHTINMLPGQKKSAYSELPNTTKPDNLEKYQCDGRTHCSQMTSCDEATFFINHCPNTEMDGDFDGIPCESQWCK